MNSGISNTALFSMLASVARNCGSLRVMSSTHRAIERLLSKTRAASVEVDEIDGSRRTHSAERDRNK